MAWNDPGRNRNPWGNRPDRGAAYFPNSTFGAVAASFGASK